MARQTGTVKWFSGQKGFGFISPDDGGEDLFVHQTSIRSDGFRALSDGDPIEFSVDRAGDGRMKAVDVTGPGGSAVASGGRGRGGYGRGGFRGGGRGGGRMSGGGGGSCYNCGRTGHLARDCYNSHGGGGGGGRGYSGGGRYEGGGGGGGRFGSGGGGGGGCYNCGEVGHFARDCPNA